MYKANSCFSAWNSKKEFTGATIFEDEQTIFDDGYKPENYSNYLGK